MLRKTSPRAANEAIHAANQGVLTGLWTGGRALTGRPPGLRVARRGSTRAGGPPLRNPCQNAFHRLSMTPRRCSTCNSSDRAAEDARIASSGASDLVRKSYSGRMSMSDTCATKRSAASSGSCGVPLDCCCNASTNIT